MVRKVDRKQKYFNVYQADQNVADQKVTLNHGNMELAEKLLFGAE